MSWKDDGTDQLTVSGDGAEVRCTARGKGDGKANAMFTGAKTGNSDCFWELKVTVPAGAGGLWIGVTMPTQFAAGYGLKGLLYGGPGNLGDGSSLVASCWGPQFADGDVVGMRLQRRDDDQDGHVVLAFSINGSPVGVAFDVVGWKPEQDLAPVVCMNAVGQAVSLVLESSDATTMQSIDSFKATPVVPAGIEGDWVGEKYSLSLDKADTNDDTWRISVQVANNLFTNLTRTSEGGWQSSGVGSTMMLPPPEMQEIEDEVRAILSAVTGLRREGDSLVLEGNGKTAVFNAAPPSVAATSEQINWMRKL